MTQLYEIKVSLSQNQKKNLSKAYHKRETIVLRLTKDSLSGNDTNLRKGWTLNFLKQTYESKWGALFCLQF